MKKNARKSWGKKEKRRKHVIQGEESRKLKGKTGRREKVKEGGGEEI